MPFLECGKCGGNSIITKEGGDYIQKCICGLYRHILREHPDGTVFMYGQQNKSTISIPDKSTNLYKCLRFMALQHPEEVTTTEAAIGSGIVRSDTASMLIVLMYKGLVERVRVGRGKEGGSVWKLTESSLHYFKME